MPYRRKIVFAAALALLLLTGFLATSLISYFVAQDSLGEQIAEESLPLTSDNIYSEIDRDLLRLILISSLMAHDTFVRDWTLDGEQDADRILRYLEQIQEKYDTTTAFYVSEHTHRYYHPSGVLKTVSPDAPADAWYFRVREMRDPYEINIDQDTADPGRVTIFINYRVTDYDGDFLGATGIGLSLNAVTDLIESYQQRYGRQIYFVDREGKVALNGSGFEGPDRLQRRPGIAAYATRILTNPSVAIDYERPDGTTVYVNTRLVPEFDWYLVVEQSASQGEARIRRTFAINLAVALAFTALVSVLAYLTLRGYQRRLEQMATTDKLTGTANRQVFDLIFRHDVRLARRRGDPLSVINLDIDGFKRLNDDYGHQGGDVIMQGVIEIVRRHLRETDTICRWGGDEFVVLLNNCGLEQASKLAETIRTAVRREPVRFGREEITVTISLGVAQYQNEEAMAAFLDRADQALYEAKRAGRDRVSMA